jgi:endonuclease/exonuclease/phosphatase family metal-dependent hydrolase
MVDNLSLWLKKIAITALFILLLLLFIRNQGIHKVAAYYSHETARHLPTANTYPIESNSCTSSEPITVLSYNVLYGSELLENLAKWFLGGHIGGTSPWSVRIPELRERIASYAPDLIGLQETHTDADVGKIIPSSDYTVVSYHKGHFQYGDAALLFKTKRFDLLESGQFWLGFTPDLPMAFSFRRISMLRYVNWAMLNEKKSHFKFLFVNTHFDNALINKESSATLFRQRIALLAKGLPIIATGDFNSNGDTERYLRLTGSKDNPPLLKNAYTLAGKPQVDDDLHPDRRIDHILAGGPCKVSANYWRVDTKPMKNGQPLSDHEPIISQLNFSAPKNKM